MIPTLNSCLLGDERPPFEPSGRRLRVTVYCPQPDRLSVEHQFRLQFLRELGCLDRLRIVGTDRSFPWHIDIDPTPNEHGAASVDLIDPENQWAGGHAFYPQDWTGEAIRLLGIGHPGDARTCALALRLPVLVAHTQTHRDLFVTSCQDLLALQSRVPEANVTDLCSALRIIGLYLRSSGDFTIRAFPKGRHTLDRELFYWVLCRHRLPAMWRYFSACLQRDRDTPNANEQLGDLAGTILTRCLRALQARDEVGFRFYRRQNNTTRSEMLYHFDYLTLLLAGAFDAGARIARLVCGLEDINLRAVNFRSQQFRQALRANGASSLGDVIDNRSFQMFQRFLGALRNSIHGTGLRGVGLDRAGEPEVSLVQVFEDHEDISEVSAAIGSREDLGVAREAGLGVTVEPYTCAVRLCEIGLEHLNGIAEATDVGRLLTEESRAGLLAGPPEDRIFGSETRRRIGALG